jgi:hypothetical protein
MRWCQTFVWDFQRLIITSHFRYTRKTNNLGTVSRVWGEHGLLANKISSTHPVLLFPSFNPLSGVGTTCFHYVVIMIRHLFLLPAACLKSILLESEWMLTTTNAAPWHTFRNTEELDVINFWSPIQWLTNVNFSNRTPTRTDRHQAPQFNYFDEFWKKTQIPMLCERPSWRISFLTNHQCQIPCERTLLIHLTNAAKKISLTLHLALKVIEWDKKLRSSGRGIKPTVLVEFKVVPSDLSPSLGSESLWIFKVVSRIWRAAVETTWERNA